MMLAKGILGLVILAAFVGLVFAYLEFERDR